MKFKFLDKAYKSMQDLKQAYYKLCKELHSDIGGNDEDMKILNNEYEYLFNKVQDAVDSDRGFSTTEEKRKEYVGKFIDIVKVLLTMDKLIIDIVGEWLWVYGETREVKDKLKELGFKWSGAKKKWYYADYLGKKKHSSSRKKYDDIIEQYGREQYIGKGLESIQ